MRLTVTRCSREWARTGWAPTTLQISRERHQVHQIGWTRGSFFIYEQPMLVAGADVLLASITHAASRMRISFATELDVAAECAEIADQFPQWARFNAIVPSPQPRLRAWGELMRDVYARWRTAGFAQVDAIADRHFVWAQRT